MDHLLYLVHRMPFPPNKGDKIRSYHLLRHLSTRYHVHLGTFIDDPDDWQHVDTVKALCGETHFAKLDPLRAKIGSLTGLLTGHPLTLDYYRDAGMRRWVDRITKQYPITRFMVFSSAMAQFVPPEADGAKVIDFVDIDSDKWSQYAAKKAWPASMVYRRESRQLLRYERRIAEAFDASLFVSDAEAQLFRSLAPEHAKKIDYFNNGVDTGYFSPAHALVNPYRAEEDAIVFTGAMDYWPNIDAVEWFVNAIFPGIVAVNPAARFYIVGSKPAAQVQALAQHAGVTVTGRVEDVRPYVAHARVSVAPLRIARGIQNKVLEAMALAKPVIVTPQALEGIGAIPGRDLVLAADAAAFTAAVNAQLARPDRALGPAARQLVIDDYGWAANLARVDRWLDADASLYAPVAVTTNIQRRPA
ncbi:MAG: TIGR03087 family PEP-CTERM/XrtA system glycosyltransferase [Herminiimonas sp.]|nr:TIGR03087 family PEP-CTERM/XrtA system glycosyltransferase [Herminiimonas sp.]